MASEVRVHVRLGDIRIQYEGDLSFYEARVESLVAAAAERGVTLGVVPPGGAGTSSVGTPAKGPETAASSAAPAPGASPLPPAPVPAAWSPTSPEFGRFIRRLGPEAAEPERQVVAFAFYLWNYERRETFGRAELEGCFKTLHLAVPDALEALLESLTDAKRFLERADGAAWRLSKKGENYVKTRLLSS